MSAKSAGNAELAEFVSDHIFRDKDAVKHFAVVHHKGEPDKLRHDGAIARPCLDGVAAAGIMGPLDLPEQFLVYERAFFRASGHRSPYL